MPSDTSRIARDGINAVEGVVIRQLGWAFREQPIEDVGVDAHIEIREDGKLTGRLIALQIKSGTSWFREVTSEGFVYRGQPRHLTYWRSHSLPVILVLYHPEEQRAWWVAIADDAIKSTERGWSIVVPKTQELDRSAAEHLRPIALPDYRQRVEIAPLSPEGPSVVASPSPEYLFQALDRAKRSIEIATPFVSNQLFWALMPIVSRGVSVRILAGLNQPSNWIPEVNTRATNRVVPEVRIWVPRQHNKGQWHAKYIVIDQTTAIFGSANFTLASWTNNAESVLATTESGTVAQFSAQFEEAWMSLEAVPLADAFRL
jgi:phosphatidylserine/phosphatidylglycerophosphate/cardiolipin synthase-like enzyme